MSLLVGLELTSVWSLSSRDPSDSISLALRVPSECVHSLVVWRSQTSLPVEVVLLPSLQAINALVLSQLIGLTCFIFKVKKFCFFFFLTKKKKKHLLHS